MVRIQLIASAGLCVCLLLCSCGESQDAAGPYDRTLGGIKEGAPLVAGAIDSGILQDPTRYQPTRLPGDAGGIRVGGRSSGGGAPGGGSLAEPGEVVDVETRVRTAVNDLVNALKDGEVELALGSFDRGQVAALTERSDPIYETFDQIAGLRAAVEARLGAAQAEEAVNRLIHGAGGAPNWNIQGEEAASVTPNLAMLLFGPVKPMTTMPLSPRDGSWEFQLDAPLAAGDVQAILEFHEAFRFALREITNWLGGGQSVEAAALWEALDKALRGEPLDLAAPAEEPPPAQAEPGGEPAGADEPSGARRGRGGGRRGRPPGG